MEFSGKVWFEPILGSSLSGWSCSVGSPTAFFQGLHILVSSCSRIYSLVWVLVVLTERFCSLCSSPSHSLLTVGILDGKYFHWFWWFGTPWVAMNTHAQGLYLTLLHNTQGTSQAQQLTMSLMDGLGEGGQANTLLDHRDMHNIFWNN